MVIADFFIVHKERLLGQGLTDETSCQGTVWADGAGLQPFLQGGDDI
jgi:hypothetical protein